MDTGNVLAVSGGDQVQIHGTLEKTLNSMTVAWTQLLSKVAEANGKLSAGMSKESNAIVDNMKSEFKSYYDDVQDEINKIGSKTKSYKLAEIQGEISKYEAKLSELQQVDSGSQSAAGNIGSDASNKVKQAVDSAQSLVGSTAAQIPQMIFGTTAQLTEQISA